MLCGVGAACCAVWALHVVRCGRCMLCGVGLRVCSLCSGFQAPAWLGVAGAFVGLLEEAGGGKMTWGSLVKAASMGEDPLSSVQSEHPE